MLLIRLCALAVVCAVPVNALAANSDVVLYAANAQVRKGTWTVVADAAAAAGKKIANTNLGAPVLWTALAQPLNYFQMSFPAYGGKPYHLWLRGKASGNSTQNDSVFVQFCDSVTATGSPIDRIGTTSAATVVLQPCAGATDQGWGWTDNGWCGLGVNIRFQNTGTHTIRVQVREDGLAIDQIVLSPLTYLTTAPGKPIDDTTILAANLPVLSSGLQVALSANPVSGAAPLAVNFYDSVKLASGYVVAHNWSFGDGQTSTEASPSHTYETTGSYTATVTVTDSYGTKAKASSVVSVGPSGSFTDTFNTGSLDSRKWLVSSGPAPGSISGVNDSSFSASNVDLSQGMLCLKLQQQQGPSGIISVGAQIQSLTTYGYGTYEWTLRTSSTSASPTGSGSAVSGQVSAGFNYINNSETEIDFEVEGQDRDTLWVTNWISTSLKQYSSVSVAAPDAGFHRYKFVWAPGKVDYYIDGVLISTHDSNVPSVPAYIMINHWGTNSTNWGGLATVGVERYLYVYGFSYTPM
jgi:endo-1,3-1,4-beta-glycanase ExoK